MRTVSVRRWIATVLLALMAWMAMPRSWFHACAHTSFELAHKGPVVHVDGHCPICEQTLPHFVAPAGSVGPSIEPKAYDRTEERSEQVLAVTTDARLARGPPMS